MNLQALLGKCESGRAVLRHGSPGRRGGSSRDSRDVPGTATPESNSKVRDRVWSWLTSRSMGEWASAGEEGTTSRQEEKPRVGNPSFEWAKEEARQAQPNEGASKSTVKALGG